MPDLKVAVRTIHADRDWWKKIGVGGTLWLTIVGWPIVEGHQLESIENSHRGFPTPLPVWVDLGGKAVIGIFALVIDFFYFVFPLLCGGFVLFCGTLAAGISGSGATARLIALSTLAIMALYLVGVWLLGASPVAKQRYVIEGELQDVLGGVLLRDLLRSPARGLYFRARMLSLPAYLVAGVLFALSIWAIGQAPLGALVLGWLAFSALVYARLLTIQLYLAATKALEKRRWEARFTAGTR